MQEIRKIFRQQLLGASGINDSLTSACARGLSARRSVFSPTSSNQLV
jgi:hypothetical protein